MKLKIYTLLFFVFCSMVSEAQFGYTGWRNYRKELTYGFGPSIFLGDLGGGSTKGSHFMSFRDVEFNLTTPAFYFGYRYKLSPHFAIRTGLAYSTLKGDDALSGDRNRRLRNLSFKSVIFELSSQVEYSIISEKRDHFYQFDRNKFYQNVNVFAFAGLGLFHFNPKAKASDGQWYSLQPLGTEGQGLKDAPKKYSLIQLSFPVGFGARYYMKKNGWSIGYQFGFRFTSTDYIDDASGSYYDNDAIRSAYGDIAAELADRRISDFGEDLPPVAGGTPWRGSPKFKDSYIFQFVTFTYTYKHSLY